MTASPGRYLTHRRHSGPSTNAFGNTNARIYRAAIRAFVALRGRWVIDGFLSADSLVPQPGDPQSLDCYSYVRNNPLRLVDPSGHADCAADDRACWEDEWNWKNRWYNAHGWYADDQGGWGRPGEASFRDAGILRDTMGELGIRFTNFDAAWQWSEMWLVAQGVVALANKIGSFAQLHNLLPTVTIFMRATHALFYYYDQSLDPPAHTIPGGNLVVFANDLFQGANDYVRGTAVHELAHVIDYFNPIGGSTYFHQAMPMSTHISDYAVQNRFGLEYWAEAVAVWVYGARYTQHVPGGDAGVFTTNQIHWVERVLKGWGW